MTSVGVASADLEKRRLVLQLYGHASVVFSAMDLQHRLAHPTLPQAVEVETLLPLLSQARATGDVELETQIQVILIGLNQRMFHRTARAIQLRGYDELDVLDEINAALLYRFHGFNPDLGYRFSTWARRQSWQVPTRVRTKLGTNTYSIEDLSGVDGEDGRPEAEQLSAGNTTAEELALSAQAHDVKVAVRTFEARIRKLLADPTERMGKRKRAFADLLLFHEPPIGLEELATATGYTRQNVHNHMTEVLEKLHQQYLSVYRYRKGFSQYLDLLQSRVRGGHDHKRTDAERAAVLLSEQYRHVVSTYRNPDKEPEPLDPTWVELETVARTLPADLQAPFSLFLLRPQRLGFSEIGRVFGYSTVEASRRVGRAMALVEAAIDASRVPILQEMDKLVRLQNNRRKRTAAEWQVIAQAPDVTAWIAPPVEPPALDVRALLASVPDLAATGMEPRHAKMFELYYGDARQLSMRAIAAELGVDAMAVSEGVRKAADQIANYLAKAKIVDVATATLTLANARNVRKTAKRGGAVAAIEAAPVPSIEAAPVPSLEPTLTLDRNHYRLFLDIAEKLRDAVAEMADEKIKLALGLRYVSEKARSGVAIASLLGMERKPAQRWLRTLDGPLVAHLLARGTLPADKEAAFRMALKEFRAGTGRRHQPRVNLHQWFVTRFLDGPPKKPVARLR